MKTVILAALLSFPAGSLSAAVLLADNFNASDNPNFDNSDQTGRRSGLIGDDVQLRSSRFQHGISNNELLLGIPTSGGSGRVRFHDLANLATWHDFASGPGGAAILADGGFRLEFDWTPVTLDNTNWVAVTVGIAGQSVAEPSIRVNHAETDFGILFRHNGGTQYFDNASATTGPEFDLDGPIHLALEYRFGSFADGSPVTVSAWAGDTAILSDHPFQWEGNNGALFMEFGSNQAGNRIDNFQLSTIPEPATAALAALAAGAVLRRRRAIP